MAYRDGLCNLGTDDEPRWFDYPMITAIEPDSSNPTGATFLACGGVKHLVPSSVAEVLDKIEACQAAAEARYDEAHTAAAVDASAIDKERRALYAAIDAAQINTPHPVSCPVCEEAD